MTFDNSSCNECDSYKDYITILKSSIFDENSIVNKTEIELELESLKDIKSEFDNLKLCNNNQMKRINSNTKITQMLTNRMTEIEKENRELKSNLKLKEDYIETMISEMNKSENLKIKIKHLRMTIDELESKLANKLSDCKLCREKSSENQLLQTRNEKYRLEIEEKESEKNANQTQMRQLRLERDKLEVENRQMRGALDRATGTESSGLARTVETLSALMEEEAQRRMRLVTNTDCNRCRDTARLIFDCFKRDHSYRVLSSAGRKLLEDHNRVKLALLSHLRQYLGTCLSVDFNNNTINELFDENELKIIDKIISDNSNSSNSTKNRNKCKKLAQVKKSSEQLVRERSPSFDSSGDTQETDLSDTEQINKNIRTKFQNSKINQLVDSDDFSNVNESNDFLPDQHPIIEDKYNNRKRRASETVFPSENILKKRKIHETFTDNNNSEVLMPYESIPDDVCAIDLTVTLDEYDAPLDLSINLKQTKVEPTGDPWECDNTCLDLSIIKNRSEETEAKEIVMNKKEDNQSENNHSSITKENEYGFVINDNEERSKVKEKSNSEVIDEEDEFKMSLANDDKTKKVVEITRIDNNSDNVKNNKNRLDIAPKNRTSSLSLKRKTKEDTVKKISNRNKKKNESHKRIFCDDDCDSSKSTQLNNVISENQMDKSTLSLEFTEVGGNVQNIEMTPGPFDSLIRSGLDQTNESFLDEDKNITPTKNPQDNHNNQLSQTERRCENDISVHNYNGWGNDRRESDRSEVRLLNESLEQVLLRNGTVSENTDRFKKIASFTSHNSILPEIINQTEQSILTEMDPKDRSDMSKENSIVDQTKASKVKQDEKSSSSNKKSLNTKGKSLFDKHRKLKLSRKLQESATEATEKPKAPQNENSKPLEITNSLVEKPIISQNNKSIANQFESPVDQVEKSLINKEQESLINQNQNSIITHNEKLVVNQNKRSLIDQNPNSITHHNITSVVKQPSNSMTSHNEKAPTNNNGKSILTETDVTNKIYKVSDRDNCFLSLISRYFDSAFDCKLDEEIPELARESVTIKSESEAEKFIDSIFDWMAQQVKEQNQPLLSGKKERAVICIYWLAVLMVQHSYRAYSYYSSRSINFIRENSATPVWPSILFTANMSLLVKANRWDDLIGVFLDFARHGSFPLLSLVMIASPQYLFRAEVMQSHSKLVEIVRRLVFLEHAYQSYSIINGSNKCSERIIDKLQPQIRDFWLGGTQSVIESGDWCSASRRKECLAGILGMIKETIDQYRLKKNPLANRIVNLDKDIESKYSR